MAERSFKRAIEAAGPVVHALGAVALLVVLFDLWQRSQSSMMRLVIGPWRRPLYQPWLVLWIGLCLLVLAWRSIPLLRALWNRVRRSRALPPTTPHESRSSQAASLPPEETGGKPAAGGGADERSAPPGPPTNPTPVRPLPSSPRLTWIDLALLAFTTTVGWLVFNTFRLKENPDGACVGMDSPTFLTAIVATGLERWDLYNGDKRLPYPWLSVQLADLTGLSYLDAAQLLSLLSAVLLIPLTYLFAKPVVGRTTACLAALLAASYPYLHPYGVQTSSYSFFYLVTLLMLAAGVWAVATRKLRHYLLLGLTAALSIATQEKGLTVLVPVLGVAWLAALPLGARAVTARTAALVIPLFFHIVLTAALPVQYTPLASLAAIHREEIHRDMGYRWPAVKQPDPATPSPFSPWLPDWIRGGTLEGFLAVTLTPPDSDVVVFRSHRSREGSWTTPEVKANTSIPPLGHRLSQNTLALGKRFPGIDLVLLTLGLLGAVALLVPMPRGLPAAHRWGGWILLASMVSVFGTLSLKFHIRYVLHVWPVAAVLVVHGVQVLAQQWTGRMGWTFRTAQQGLVGWFVLCLALSLWTRSERVWLRAGEPLPDLYRDLGAVNFESDTSHGIALRRVAEWLHLEGPPDALFYDCSPIPVWLLSHMDTRYVVPTGAEGLRFRFCQEIIAHPTPGHDVYVVVSDLPQYRFPDTPSTSLLFQQPHRWKLVYGVNPGGEEVLWKSGSVRASPDAVLVFKSIRGPTGGGSHPPLEPVTTLPTAITTADPPPLSPLSPP